MNEDIGIKLLFKIMLERNHIEKLNKIIMDQNINEETLFMEALESFKTKYMQTDYYNPNFTEVNLALMAVYEMNLGYSPLEELAILYSKFRIDRVKLIREVLLSYLENDKDK